MSAFFANNIYNSFKHSVCEAAFEQKFYFCTPLSVRRSRRLRFRPVAASVPPVAVPSPFTAGGVIEEDIEMSYFPPSSPSVPCLPRPTKRIRRSPSSTTECTTTAFWCVPDVDAAIECEKNWVRGHLPAYAIPVCLSVSSGVSVSAVVLNNVHTIKKIEGIARELLSLSVPGVGFSGFSGVLSPAGKKRPFREVW